MVVVHVSLINLFFHRNRKLAAPGGLPGIFFTGNKFFFLILYHHGKIMESSLNAILFEKIISPAVKYEVAWIGYYLKIPH